MEWVRDGKRRAILLDDERRIVGLVAEVDGETTEGVAWVGGGVGMQAGVGRHATEAGARRAVEVRVRGGR